MIPASSRAPDGPGLTLVMNAAEGVLEIGIGGENGAMLYGGVINAPSRGVEILTPAVAAAFSVIGEEISHIRRIAVVRGPGSFTGLRLVTATAAGLARSVGALQAGFDYMDCLARQYQPFLTAAGPDDGQLWILVRARRDLVYARPYAHGEDQNAPPKPLAELAVLPVASGEAAARVLETASQGAARRILFAGSGARENRDALASALSVAGNIRATFVDAAFPLPGTLLRMADECAYAAADIEPLYARVSDAETSLPRIANRLGIDPGEAIRKLHELTHTLPVTDEEE